MHGRSRTTIDPRTPVQCRDGARRVFTDQADIACCTKQLVALSFAKQAPARCLPSRMVKDELHPTTARNACEASFGTFFYGRRGSFSGLSISVDQGHSCVVATLFMYKVLGRLFLVLFSGQYAWPLIVCLCKATQFILQVLVCRAFGLFYSCSSCAPPWISLFLL